MVFTLQREANINDMFGVFSYINSFSSESFNDFGNTENMVAITQLREEVESLKRALNTKDQQILERDKKVLGIGKLYTFKFYNT